MSIRYSEDFKLTVVHEYEMGKKSNALIALEYGIAKSTVTKWVQIYSKECPRQTSHTTTVRDSSKRIRQLNKRIAELERENLFLKKATAFFVREID